MRIREFFVLTLAAIAEIFPKSFVIAVIIRLVSPYFVTLVTIPAVFTNPNFLTDLKAEIAVCRRAAAFSIS